MDVMVHKIKPPRLSYNHNFVKYQLIFRLLSFHRGTDKDHVTS